MGTMGTAALLVLLLALPALCTGKITGSKVSKDERSIILIARPFGFTATGVIEVKIDDDKVFLPEHSPPANKAKLGFFLTTAEAESQLEADLSDGGCVLDSQNIDRLFTFQEIENQRAADGSFSYISPISPDHGGEYSLFFANCQPEVVISFEIRVSMYNTDMDGVKNFLSAGESELPIVYMAMFVLFTCATTIWLVLLFKSASTLLKIHVMMAVLIIMKTMTLLSQAGMYELIKTTGSPDGWNIAYYVFTFFRSLFLFTVIVLIGTGWSFLKYYLTDKDKKVFMVVIPLQVVANIAEIILDESGPAVKGWFTWRDIFHLLDIICCCAILFPIVWSIKHLREASHTDGKAKRNVEKLMLFRQFYVMVVSYIYFTRIVVYLLKSTMPYQFIWVSDAAGEVATLCFYCFTGFKFRPAEDNPYSLAFQEEDEEDEEEDEGEGKL